MRGDMNNFLILTPVYISKAGRVRQRNWTSMKDDVQLWVSRYKSQIFNWGITLIITGTTRNKKKVEVHKTVFDIDKGGLLMPKGRNRYGHRIILDQAGIVVPYIALEARKYGRTRCRIYILGFSDLFGKLIERRLNPLCSEGYLIGIEFPQHEDIGFRRWNTTITVSFCMELRS